MYIQKYIGMVELLYPYNTSTGTRTVLHSTPSTRVLSTPVLVVLV
jgi:hypothetical protein